MPNNDDGDNIANKPTELSSNTAASQ